MADGEVVLSGNVLLSNPDSASSLQSSTSTSAVTDELLKNTRTCTHTHTCNPPGPDAAHTHTCYHSHTQVFASKDYPGNDKENNNSKQKRPLGNREAVRKYREKKKAQTAILEEEVKKLRLLNQQLVRKLQGQQYLEAEVLRLRSILFDLKGKIDTELSTFPFQMQCNSTPIFKKDNNEVQACDRATTIHCQTSVPCLHPDIGSLKQDASCGIENIMVPLDGNFELAAVDCQLGEDNKGCTEFTNHG